MTDLLDRTATQVRMPGKVIHIRDGGQFVPGLGQHYRARCGVTLYGEAGAVLTTFPVTCRDCAPAAFGTKRDEPTP